MTNGDFNFGFNSVSLMCDDNSIIDFSVTVVSSTAGAAKTIVLAMVTAWRKEEDKKCKVKKSPFSKQVGVALERENKFFLRRK